MKNKNLVCIPLLLFNLISQQVFAKSIIYNTCKLPLDKAFSDYESTDSDLFQINYPVADIGANTAEKNCAELSGQIIFFTCFKNQNCQNQLIPHPYLSGIKNIDLGFSRNNVSVLHTDSFTLPAFSLPSPLPPVIRVESTHLNKDTQLSRFSTKYNYCTMTVQEVTPIPAQMPNSLCGFDAQALTNLTDIEYFNTVIDQLSSIVNNPDNIRTQNGSQKILSQIYIELPDSTRQRRVPLEHILKVKDFINALNISPNNSNQYLQNKNIKAYWIVDYYVRLVRLYLNQRTVDIINLQRILSNLEGTTADIRSASQLVKVETEKLNVSSKVKESILSNFNQDFNQQNVTALISITKDVLNLIRSDASSLNQQTTVWLKSISALDPIFSLAQIHMLLINGSPSQILTTLQINYDLSRKQNLLFIFNSIVKDLHLEVSNELRSANKIYDTLNSTSIVAIPDAQIMSSQDSSFSYSGLPMKVIAFLENSKLKVGDSTDAVKYQLLNAIDINMIAPMNSAKLKLESFNLNDKN